MAGRRTVPAERPAASSDQAARPPRHLPMTEARFGWLDEILAE